MIATGARPAAPSIKGLEETGYLTNETIFSLTELPPRLIVIGGGPIGCELAQTFRRLGSQVWLVNRSERVLRKDSPEASELIRRRFEAEGIHLHLGVSIVRVEKTGDAKSIVLERQGQQTKLLADEILLAAGRRPNVEGLGLEAAGVKYDRRGVVVDDFLRTTNRRIYAAGDICGRYQFTHAADAMARICIQNALFLGRKRLSRLVVPWTTYTDPEVAHVGLTAEQAAQQGLEIDTYREELADVDRAILDGEDEGLAMVHTRKGSGRIVGATIVASHAGEMIGEMSLMMTKRLSLGALSGTIHCYPTQVEVLKRIGDAYARGRLSPWVASMFRRWLAWRR